MQSGTRIVGDERNSGVSIELISKFWPIIYHKVARNYYCKICTRMSLTIQYYHFSLKTLARFLLSVVMNLGKEIHKLSQWTFFFAMLLILGKIEEAPIFCLCSLVYWFLPLDWRQTTKIRYQSPIQGMVKKVWGTSQKCFAQAPKKQ